MGILLRFSSVLRTFSFHLLFYFLTFETFSTLCAAQLESPPSIFRQLPPEDLLFQVATDRTDTIKPFVLECEASGSPAPTYKWFKNGKQYDFHEHGDRIVQQPSRGSLVVTQPRSEDEGYYHCEATNKFGTSVSNACFIRRSELGSFPEVKPQEIVVEEGESVTLSCNLPIGFPKPDIFWMIQTSSGVLKSINNSRTTVDPEGALRISSVSMRDSSVDAYYTCCASIVFINEYKTGNKIKLTVIPSERWGIAPLKQYCSPQNIVARRGAHQDIHCIFGGKPLPEIRWKKKNERLYSSRYSLENYGKTLRLRNIDFGDAGMYECTASNGIGNALSCATSITVQSVPYWITSPDPTYAAEGESARFECVASGVPEPTVKWFVNGVDLSLAAANPRRKLINSTVMIIEALTTTDTAVYQCNASNALGYAFKDFYLHILLLFPEIMEPPEAFYEVVEGSPITLRCHVISAPQSEIKWLRNGKELTDVRYIIKYSGDLQITQALFTNAGHYKCTAENKLGRVESDDSLGHLVVRESTIIINVPEDYAVVAGKSASFCCSAYSDPNLKLMIEWQVNGQTIDFEGDRRLSLGADNTLTIFNTTKSDSGVYTCVAKTRLDNVTARASLIVQDIPDAPRIVSVVCKNKSAVIEWQPQADNHASLQFYSILYNTGYNLDVWQTVDDRIRVTKLKYEISPLKPWTNYTFGVTAHNKIGSSVRSNFSSVCQTSPDVPYSNPVKVSSTAKFFSNFAIFWKPMSLEEQNGPGFFYRVFWKRADAGVDNWQIQDVVQRNSLTLSDQPLNVPHVVKVESHNELGKAADEAEEVILYAGEHKPQVIVKNLRLLRVFDSKTAVIVWDSVPLDSIRGHFQGFKIQIYNSEEDNEIAKEKVVKGNVSSAVIDILTPFFHNYVRVRVFTNPYDGPRSDAIAIITPEGKPGPVSSLDTVSIGSTMVCLTWLRPEQTNGHLLFYQLFYQKITGPYLSPSKPLICNLDVITTNLGGLAPNTKYRITIQASTGAGLGSPSFVDVLTRNETLSYKPSFSWFLVDPSDDHTSAKVTWIPHFYGYFGRKFYVKYRQDEVTEWQKTEVAFINEDNFIFTGFLPGIYKMMVVIVNGLNEETGDVLEIQASAEPISSTHVETKDGKLDLKITWKLATIPYFSESFIVNYREKSKGKWQKIDFVPYNERFTIEGLSKGIDYEINVFLETDEDKID